MVSRLQKVVHKISIPSLGSVILESKITPDHPYQKQEVSFILFSYTMSQCSSVLVIAYLFT